MQEQREKDHQIYNHINELPRDDQSLLLKAKEALQFSYSPYSNFKVGSALRLCNGETFMGSNLENASYPLCLCAERSAIAACQPFLEKYHIETIAVTALNPARQIDDPVAPCGACRQVIFEMEHRQNKEIRIIMQGEIGEIRIVSSARHLLPYVFDNRFL